MVRGLWYFHCVFFMELVYGIYNPSLADLGHSTRKKIYCLVIILTTCSIEVWDVLTDRDPFDHGYMILLWAITNRVFSTYYMTLAMVHYRSKISAVMNLVAIENLVDNGTTPHLKRTVCSFIVYVIILAIVVFNYLYTIWWSFSFQMMYALAYIQYIGMTLAMFLGCFGYLMKILSINQSIENRLRGGIGALSGELFSHPEHGVPRLAWPEGQEGQLQVRQALALMRTMEGVLHETQEETTSWYRVYVLWTTIVTGVFVHLDLYYALLMGERSAVLSIITGISGLFLLITIVVLTVCSERIAHAQAATRTSLSALLVRSGRQEDRRALTHRLLAAHHRRHSFRCHLFDLGYPLIFTIIDTSLLVFTTLFSK